MGYTCQSGYVVAVDVPIVERKLEKLGTLWNLLTFNGEPRRSYSEIPQSAFPNLQSTSTSLPTLL